MKIAATDGKKLYPVNGAAPRDTGLKLTGAGHVLGRLLDMAAAQDIRQLWVLPGCPLHKRLGRLKKTPATEKTGWTIKPDNVRNILTGWQEKRKSIQIVSPGLKDEQWALDNVHDAGLWREVLEILINYTGVAPSIPIRTARVLAEDNINTGWLTRPSDLEPFEKHVESDLFFHRVPDEKERALAWLHVYDKKKMYLSAFGSTLGVGETREVRGGEFDGKAPGLWWVDLRNDLHFHKVMGWNVLTEKTQFAQGVFYTPVLAYLKSVGLNIKVKRAILYEYKHRPFEATYKKLRRAFAEIPGDTKYSPDARAVAVDCLKACYTRFIGWMAHNPGTRVEKWYRPDWRNAIVAEAKARIAYNVQRVYESKGLRPVGIRTDSVMFLSDDPNAATALPEPFSGPNYSVKYSLPASLALPLLTMAGQSIQTIDNELYKLAQRKGKK